MTIPDSSIVCRGIFIVFFYSISVRMVNASGRLKISFFKNTG